MKALLLSDKKKLELTEMPAPEAGAGDLLVRIKACGICGSDVHGYDGSTGRRIPPIVMGHEAAGVVERVGAGVGKFKVGDRITFDSTVYCGKCDYCKAGKINLCDNRRVLGVSCGDYRQHGCFAEYAAIPERIAYALPDALGFDHAAMVEAVSIGVHAVNRAGAAGEFAVVVGVGMIGQLTVQALKAAGWGKVIAVDLDESRLEKAKQCGAEIGLNAGRADLVEEIRKITGGGAHAAFEVAGMDKSFRVAVDCVRKGGTVVLVGNSSPKVEMALQTVVTKELSLLGSCASRGEYPQCLDLMGRGKIDVRPLISAVAPLEEGASWFARLYAHEAGLMKVILTP